MRLSLALFLLLGVGVFLAAAETTSRPRPSRRPIDPNCQRARPIERMRLDGRAKCMYVCKGSPKRIGLEPNGTPCDRRGKKRLPGVCLAGSCVKTEHSMVSFDYSNAAEPKTGQQEAKKLV
ncbi:hypothetical protein V5799_020510 [Amblyomma americanum]|uniref:Secreted protein n=1 Tax=Amblyomma americanum TaxID=6943 RepID=A0AAQ4ETV9_AMBAM